MKRLLSIILGATLLVTAAACTKSCGTSEPSKRVYFVSPSNNDKVQATFHVKMAVEGMKIRPAMEDINDTTSGHFHILIDVAEGFTEKGLVVGEDARHIHYGKGQTETDLTLPPGRHRLTIQFADGAHRSYGKELAQSITVDVGGG